MTQHAGKVSTSSRMRLARYFSVLLIAAAWWNFASFEQKFISFMMAGWFSCIETCWTGLTSKQRSKNRHRLHPVRIVLDGHTTWEQFWVLAAYAPICHELYFHLITEPWVRILLFAPNVWLCEIVTGYYLTTFWQRRAWLYDDRLAYLDGNITLLYGPLWLILGMQHELTTTYFYEPISTAITGSLTAVVPQLLNSVV